MTAPSKPTWMDAVACRPQLTAKALRALGRPVPANVPDEECAVLVVRP